MEDAKKDISIYINSPGGSVTSGLAIYDTMQFVTCDVNTYCIGIAASMGAVLLCAGTKGKRYALPNSDIMIHQVSGGAQGQASDVERQVEFMFKLKKRLNGILSLHTGKSAEQVNKDADRDYYMTAEEAKEYGLVDEVVKSRKELKGLDKPPSSVHGPHDQSDDVFLLWQKPLGGPQAHRGPGVYICDSCITVCKGILDKEFKEENKKGKNRDPRPQAGRH